MQRQLFAASRVFVCVLMATTALAAGDRAAEPAVRYLPLDAPEGASQAVIVENAPLVFTRQIFPTTQEGVVQGPVEKQSEQLIENLQRVLGAAGSGLDKLVRVHVYALSHEAAASVGEQLKKRLPAAVRPAVTVVLTPLPLRKALVAIDAIAVRPAAGEPNVLPILGDDFATRGATDRPSFDAAILPPDGAVYLSGVPERGTLTEGGVERSLATLQATLRDLNLEFADVVQMKVFLTPASSAAEVRKEIQKFFPGRYLPPIVYVEWIASAPVEIELVARLPKKKLADGLLHYTPQGMRPTSAFSRVAIVHQPRQVFISGLSSRTTGDGEAQSRDVFEQLQKILAATGSDFRHLAKATYYVSDDDASTGLNAVRGEFLDPDCPPAASKVTVHGVGRPGRTLTLDMIAVGAEK